MGLLSAREATVLSAVGRCSSLPHGLSPWGKEDIGMVSNPLLPLTCWPRLASGVFF